MTEFLIRSRKIRVFRPPAPGRYFRAALRRPTRSLLGMRGSHAVAALAVVAALSADCRVAAETKSFTLKVEKKVVQIGGGMRYDAWTYDGAIPGPVLRVRQGDDVKIELINHTPDAHGINIHAAQIDPKNFGGDTRERLAFQFRAETPGAFVYHCNGIPILDHIGRGMYGAMIVDPKGGWPSGAAQEVVLVQSEFYGLPSSGGWILPEHSKMLEGRADFVVFNGELNKYGAEHPIQIKVGRLVRVLFVNAGPNLASTFHVAGAIFSAAYPGGNPENVIRNVDNVMVAPSAGVVVEFRVSEPGDYRFMDVERAHEYNGAMGVFRAVP